MKAYIKMCIAFCLCVVFAFNTAAMAVTFKDVGDTTQYKDSIITLSTLGLIKGYEDGSFKPDSGITRAEFTTMIIRALDLEDERSKEVDVPFMDLLGHYARFNIMTAYEMGIINGFGDGDFHPDDEITYEQAMKIVVCTLGYGDKAVAYGGYPMGYLTVGGQLGLTKEITAGNSEPASRGVIAKLIDNSLNVKMQRPYLNYDGSVTYKITEETLLGDRLKIERVKVLVTGIGDSIVAEGSRDLKSYEMSALKTKDDKELILDVSGVYKDYDEVKKYLGHNVYLYYKDIDENESDCDVLIAIDSETQKSSEVVVKSREVVSYDNEELRYLVSKTKEDTVKLDMRELSIVYNNKVAKKTDEVVVAGEEMTVEEAVSVWFDPDEEGFFNGEAQFIDSDNDGVADIVNIMNYEVMLAIAAPSSTDYTINDKLVSGNKIILDPDDDNYEYKIIRNGSEIEYVTSIRANDVILCAKSIEEDYITLDVTAKPVTGSITDIDDSVITINNNEYELTDICLENLEKKDEIKIGTSGTFYIDSYNNIIFATINKNNTSVMYAYMINIAENNETDALYTTLYSPKVSANSTKKYNFGNKVLFNGSNISSDRVKSKLADSSVYSRADIENQDKVYANSSTAPKANEYAQLIKYSVKKDEISSIVTVSEPELDSAGQKGQFNEESDELVLYAPLAKYKYSSTNNFSNVFQINASTTIMYVPGDRSDKGEYHKYTASSIFKVNQSYWVEAYDVNTSKVAGLVIVYGNSSLADITKDTVMSVVAKEPTLVDISGETVNKLTLYNSTASLTTKNADNDEEFADVEVGDVIQYGQSNNNRAINKRDIVLADDVREALKAKDGFDWKDGRFNYAFEDDNGNVEMDSETNTIYSRGFVANVVEVVRNEDENYIRVTQDGFDADGNIITDNDERYDIASNTPIIRFDVNKETVSAYADGTTSKLTIDSLRDAKYSGDKCSKIFMYTLKGKVKFIMIYEY